mmetsp:Transcript_3802/g.11608  ORF Transcript_3802/g.11608 Transcript_3802/m.11608 type:complete len:296 (+) Transcript_3802:95-982(+)
MAACESPPCEGRRRAVSICDRSSRKRSSTRPALGRAASSESARKRKRCFSSAAAAPKRRSASERKVASAGGAVTALDARHFRSIIPSAAPAVSRARERAPAASTPWADQTTAPPAPASAAASVESSPASWASASAFSRFSRSDTSMRWYAGAAGFRSKSSSPSSSFAVVCWALLEKCERRIMSAWRFNLSTTRDAFAWSESPAFAKRPPHKMASSSSLYGSSAKRSSAKSRSPCVRVRSHWREMPVVCLRSCSKRRRRSFSSSRASRGSSYRANTSSVAPSTRPCFTASPLSRMK